MVTTRPTGQHLRLAARYLPWSPPDQQGRLPLLWDPHPYYHLGRHILAPCTSTMPPSTGSAHSMGLLSHWIRPPLFHGIHSHAVLLGATSHDLASAHVRQLRHHPLDPATTWDPYPIGSAHLFALHTQRFRVGPSTSTTLSSAGSAHSMGPLSHWIRQPFWTPHPTNWRWHYLRCHPLDPPTAWDSYPIGSANLFGFLTPRPGVGTCTSTTTTSTGSAHSMGLLSLRIRQPL